MNEFEVKIYEIKWWFDNEYTKQEQKLRRLQAMNKLCDNGNNPHDELIKLYNEAEIKRQQIHDLEEQNKDNVE